MALAASMYSAHTTTELTTYFNTATPPPSATATECPEDLMYPDVNGASETETIGQANAEATPVRDPMR